jgi:hypothetical protein
MHQLVPEPKQLDFSYAALFYYLRYPVHPHRLARRWQMVDTTLDPAAWHLENLEQWGWLARKPVSLPGDLTGRISPDIVGLTQAGLQALRELLPNMGGQVWLLDAIWTKPDEDREPLAIWAEGAVGYALEAGNAVSAAPFRYEVRWRDAIPHLSDLLGFDFEPEYWVQFWPDQGRQRPCVGVYTCRAWPPYETLFPDPHQKSRFRDWFVEFLEEEELPAFNIDGLYWVALTPEVAASLIADLEWFLTETPAPARQPRPDVAVFTLDALLEHWLPAPHQLRRWQGRPPTQCRAARPMYFWQGG